MAPILVSFMYSIYCELVCKSRDMMSEPLALLSHQGKAIQPTLLQRHHVDRFHQVHQHSNAPINVAATGLLQL